MGACFRTALTVTAAILFLCSQAHAGQANNSSQFKLKNETENLMTDTYSPEVKLMNLIQENNGMPGLYHRGILPVSVFRHIPPLSLSLRRHYPP
jgi:hypothetical protein